MKLDPHTQYGLLMDGVSVRIALKNHPGLIRNVAMACESVVCCRMSPLQKSQVNNSFDLNLSKIKRKNNEDGFFLTDSTIGEGGQK